MRFPPGEWPSDADLNTISTAASNRRNVSAVSDDIENQLHQALPV